MHCDQFSELDSSLIVGHSEVPLKPRTARGAHHASGASTESAGWVAFRSVDVCMAKGEFVRFQGLTPQWFPRAGRACGSGPLPPHTSHRRETSATASAGNRAARAAPVTARPAVRLPRQAALPGPLEVHRRGCWSKAEASCAVLAVVYGERCVARRECLGLQGLAAGCHRIAGRPWRRVPGTAGRCSALAPGSTGSATGSTAPRPPSARVAFLCIWQRIFGFGRSQFEDHDCRTECEPAYRAISLLLRHKGKSE